VALAALKNEEEIDLDMDDIEGPSAQLQQAAEKNQEKIHLDLEDDDIPLHQRGVSQTSSTDIPEPDIRMAQVLHLSPTTTHHPTQRW